jgi:hypothetical protein
MLHAHLSAQRPDDPRDARLVDLVCATLDRADRIVPRRHGETWDRLLQLLDHRGSDPRALAECAVAANLVALEAFDDPEDYAAVADLTEDLGPDRLAQLQHRSSRLLEADPSLPWTTSVVRRLVVVGLRERLLEALPAGRFASETAVACGRAAELLVFKGIDLTWTAPLISTVDEFLAMTDESSIVEWRHHLAMVAASPWSPYTHRLIELAKAADRPHSVTTLEACVERCREQYREREREIVAVEITRLVALSGATQRDFAAWVGTSASRLATYMSGDVTPSAAMLLRITRAARSLQEHETWGRSVGAGPIHDPIVDPDGFVMG